MDLWAIANHLLNFIAPACVVGCVLPLLAPVVYRKVPPARVLCAQAAINSVAGVGALAIGLWYFGNDGKMASYLFMVLAIATAQCVARYR